jgi:hypothetical protein
MAVKRLDQKRDGGDVKLRKNIEGVILPLLIERTKNGIEDSFHARGRVRTNEEKVKIRTLEKHKGCDTETVSSPLRLCHPPMLQLE